MNNNIQACLAYSKKVTHGSKCLKYLYSDNPKLKRKASDFIHAINIVWRYTICREHKNYKVFFVANQILRRPDLEIVPGAL